MIWQGPIKEPPWELVADVWDEAMSHHRSDCVRQERLNRESLARIEMGQWWLKRGRR